MKNASPASLLKKKLRQGKTTFGFWVTLESPSITEIIGRMGFDWIVLDAERSHLDLPVIMEHIRVANLLRTACFVHIPVIEMEFIGRMLDMGADGVILPQVRSAEDVKLGIRCAKYPPLGNRGLSASRATRWCKAMKERVTYANAETMVIPMVETVEAAEALDSILDVPGIDAILFGPADFSSSAGFPGDWEGPGVAERILKLQKRIRARGIPCAVMAGDPQDALRRQKEQFQMIGLGSDTGALIRSATEALRTVGGKVSTTAWE